MIVIIKELNNRIFDYNDDYCEENCFGMLVNTDVH